MTEDSIDDAATVDDTRSRFGRVKFGGGRWPALWTALPFGLLLAIGAGAIAVATGVAGPRPVFGGIAFVFVMLWPCTGLVWAFLVDRNTLRGTTPHPEQSIESAWYDRAAAGAFSDILLVVGLSTTAVALSGIEVPTSLALAGVVVFAMGAFGIRYFVQQRRG
ncbi:MULTISPECIES: hypothetical protein [unclassified Microbacterium]|uniref:hypothetical protein n=1 Tax=unclassified Microbacterium TaxID=2609290 RepID=UPI00386963AA